MENFIFLINKLLTFIKKVLYILYYKATFLLNKQKTLHNMVEPILQEKLKTNVALSQELHMLKLQNVELEKEIHLLIQENQLVKNEISLIQDLLVKNSI